MNVIKLTTQKDCDGNAIYPAQAFIKTTAEADVEESLGGAIRFAFEVELLRGYQQPRAKGGTIYRFELDEEKALQLAQLVTVLFFPLNAN